MSADHANSFIVLRSRWMIPGVVVYRGWLKIWNMR